MPSISKQCQASIRGCSRLTVQSVAAAPSGRGAEKDDEEPAEYQDVAHQVFCGSAAVAWSRGIDWL